MQKLDELAYRPMACMNCCIPSQYVVCSHRQRRQLQRSKRCTLPEPGGPMTTCPNDIGQTVQMPALALSQFSALFSGFKGEICRPPCFVNFPCLVRRPSVYGIPPFEHVPLCQPSATTIDGIRSDICPELPCLTSSRTSRPPCASASRAPRTASHGTCSPILSWRRPGRRLRVQP